MSGYRYERATSAHAEGLLALFESAGSGCFCNYWHFDGDKNAWLERCYVKPEENRQALVARLAEPALCGVVAVRNEASERIQSSEPSERGEGYEIAGWMKVVPASAVTRLYDQRVYRRLPCFEQAPEVRQNTYTIACVYVAEAERGRGVARALLNAAIVAARDAGAVALEAFPRGAPEGEERLRADAVWTGPENMFVQAGFRAQTDFRAYPVLRLAL